MMKLFEKRILAFLLVLVTVLSLCCLPAAAAQTLTLLDGQVKVECNGSASAFSLSGEAPDEEIAVSVTANFGQDCQGDYYTKVTTEFTVNNPTEMNLRFRYSDVILNSGSVLVGGNSVTEGGSCQLAPGEQLKITITTGEDENSTTSLRLSSFKLIGVADAFPVTFIAPAHGKIAYQYGDDSTEITEGAFTVSDVDSNTGVSASAVSAESGYSFFAWTDENGNRLSADAQTVFLPDGNLTVTALFTQADEPVFSVGDKLFTDLNAALTFADAGTTKTVVFQKKTATLPAGRYTVPAGVTLLIPMDAIGTSFTSAPRVNSTKLTTPSAYSTLTLARGAVITVEAGGVLSVPAEHTSSNGGRKVAVSGPYGYLKMSAGSAVELYGELYAYGYISGDGVINARSGSQVYEIFQIADWRGGTVSMKMLNNSQGVFPFNQYYVQNIESKLSLFKGAEEKAITSITAGGMTKSATIPFIGGPDSLFELVSDDAVATKYYSGTADKTYMDIQGDTQLNSIVISIQAMFNFDFDSAGYVMPINNLIVSVDNGVMTLNNRYEFLPDSGVIIKENGAVDIGESGQVYVIARDDYGPYSFVPQGAWLSPVNYSPTRGKNKRSTNGSAMADALLEIDGTVNVNGVFETSVSHPGAVSPQQTGTINFNSEKTGAIYGNIFKSGEIGTFVPIDSVSILLKNGAGADPEMLSTVGHKSDAVYSCDPESNKWYTTYQARFYYDTDTDSEPYVMTVRSGEIPVYDGPEPVSDPNPDEFAERGDRYAWSFVEWSPEPEEAYEDMDYEAIFDWVEKTFTVTFADFDGTVLDSMTLTYGETPTFSGAAPERPDSGNFTYRFAGWDKTISAATEDITYTAVYSRSPILKLRGDANGNGRVEISDATLIQRYIAYLCEDEDGTVVILGDVNSDGLNVLDATFIQRYLAEIDNPYDIEEPLD